MARNAVVVLLPTMCPLAKWENWACPTYHLNSASSVVYFFWYIHKDIDKKNSSIHNGKYVSVHRYIYAVWCLCLCRQDVAVDNLKILRYSIDSVWNARDTNRSGNIIHGKTQVKNQQQIHSDNDAMTRRESCLFCIVVQAGATVYKRKSIFEAAK